MAADHAREDYEVARATAKQFAPDFTQPGKEFFVYSPALLAIRNKSN